MLPRSRKGSKTFLSSPDKCCSPARPTARRAEWAINLRGGEDVGKVEARDIHQRVASRWMMAFHLRDLFGSAGAVESPVEPGRYFLRSCGRCRTAGMRVSTVLFVDIETGERESSARKKQRKGQADIAKSHQCPNLPVRFSRRRLRFSVKSPCTG